MSYNYPGYPPNPAYSQSSQPPSSGYPTSNFPPTAAPPQPGYSQHPQPTYPAPAQPQQPSYSTPAQPLQTPSQPSFSQPSYAQQGGPAPQALQGHFQFDTMHEDLIHDAQMDYYGRRLATASSDRTVRVWEVPVSGQAGGKQRLVATLSGHEGPVWQVAWAHPRFGSVLASCSYDGSVIIWKESAQQPQQQQQQYSYGAPAAAAASQSWIKVKEHCLHEASVNAIAWAAPEFGLSLACASSDGRISVLSYQPDSSTWTVNSWTAHQVGVNALSWHPNALRLASGGCDNAVRIWHSVNGEWREESQSPLEPGHSDWVRDVAWAPNFDAASSASVLASCGQDKNVLIWRQSQAGGEWSSQPLRPDTFADVCWTVDWSLAGSLLAVTCGDSRVSVWRQREAADGNGWEQVQELP